MPSTSPGARATAYAHNGRFDKPDTEFVPDEVVDRSCVLGTVGDHLAVLRELEALGGDQFNVTSCARRWTPRSGAGAEVIPTAGR